jgi:hypothetical protein
MYLVTEPGLCYWPTLRNGIGPDPYSAQFRSHPIYMLLDLLDIIPSSLRLSMLVQQNSFPNQDGACMSCFPPTLHVH